METLKLVSPKGDATLIKVSLEDEDQIDVMLHVPQVLTLILVPSNEADIEIKVKRSTKFKTIMEAYTKKAGKAMLTFKMLLDGAIIGHEDTPESLKLEDGDRIQVMINQKGGYFLLLS
eukprot:gene3951-5666_t